MTTITSYLKAKPGQAFFKIYTIGYSVRSFKTMANLLINNQIDKVVDVRFDRWSRNKDFNGLDQNLALKFLAYGIDYEYRWELGNPPALRNLFKRDRKLWRLEFFKRFHAGERLAYQDLFTRETTCLMCSEKKHLKCHRSELAKWITQGANPKIRVKHL